MSEGFNAQQQLANPQLPWGLQDISEFRQKRIEVGQPFIKGGSRALIEGFERQTAKPNYSHFKWE